MEKTKITEIKEKYISTVTTKDALGNRIRVQKEFTRYVEVPFVEGWARFGHYLLDFIFSYIFYIILCAFILVPLVVTGALSDTDEVQINIIDNFTLLFSGPLYYFIFEVSAQASLAKLMLGRVVVNEYGEKAKVSQILGRSFARLVPFEAFSCLGTLGWHDRWSRTYVIRKKDLQHLRNLIAVQNFDTDAPILPKASII